MNIHKIFSRLALSISALMIVYTLIYSIFSATSALAQTDSGACAKFTQSTQQPFAISAAIPLSPNNSIVEGGIFFTNQVTITLRGDECLALASTRDGRGAIWVADAINLRVDHPDTSKSQWARDFRSTDRKSIIPVPAQDISHLFTRGQNNITVLLQDLSSPTFASSALWLVVFIPPSPPTNTIPVTAQITPTLATPTSSEVSFALLNTREISLRGPVASYQIEFSLPADWQFTGNSALRLNFSTYSPARYSATQNATTPIFTGGFLTVRFNSTLIGTIQMTQDGANSVTLPISNTDWITPNLINPVGLQSLTFDLFTNEPCDVDSTVVIIQPSSAFLVPHQIKTPTTDLTRLPFPIVQRSFLPDTATLIMPDQPTAAELQAALTVAAGMGRMSFGSLVLTYTTTSKLNAVQNQNNHLIFVGKPTAFPQLAQLTLPVPIANQTFTDAEVQADDGVVQMIPSPWNNAKVLLFVSGQSERGVIKASQAVGSGLVRTGTRSNVAIVAETQSKPISVSTLADHLLSDLGYGTITRLGPGLGHATIYFQVPYDQAVSDGAYLDLTFSNAAVLDFDQSSLSVTLNDDYIGSTRLSDRTTRVSTWRVNLPRAAFRPGTNMLVLEANLQAPSRCINIQDARLWLTVRPESNIHYTLGTPKGTARQFDLSDYPSPFIPSFDRTAFIVADNDPSGWNVAAQLAFDLGQRTEGTLINMAVAYANNIPDTIRQQRDLLIVGRPSTLPILTELAQAMPGSFDTGSDIANEPNSQIKFRVSKDTPIGYLQTFPAPWSQQRNVLAVLGTNDKGLSWASTALTTSVLRSQLTGNFAIINGTQIQIASRYVPTSATPVPDQTPVAARSTPVSPLAGLDLTIIGGAVVGVLILLILATIVLRRK